MKLPNCKLIRWGVVARGVVFSFLLAVPAWSATVQGIVVDSVTQAPIEGVSIFIGLDGGFGATDANGQYTIEGVTPATYDVRAFKTGYVVKEVTGFEVLEGVENQLSVPLDPRDLTPSGETEDEEDTNFGAEDSEVGASDIFEMDALEVTVEEATESMMQMEIRMNSDRMIDIMGTQDFARFATGDVAGAAQKVVGVSVVEGQFAVIRGLEDRYGSTLVNGASIPSPDPNRQSVQLDLFSTDVVSAIQVTKSFGADQPGNSAGGSFNIVTAAYPLEPNTISIKLSAGTGFNSNSMDRYLTVVPGNAVPRESKQSPYESDFGLGLSGRRDFGEREVRFILNVSRERDYQTRVGTFNEAFPLLQKARNVRIPGVGTVRQVTPGSLSFGEMPGGDMYGSSSFTRSTYSELISAFAGVGFDLTPTGNHKLDLVFFRTEATEEMAELFDDFENPAGAVPYDPELYNIDDGDRGVDRLPAADAERFKSRSIERDRTLTMGQLRGDHTFSELNYLKFNWNLSYVETSQDSGGRTLSYWLNPHPVTDFDGNTAPDSYHLYFGQEASDNPLKEAETSIEESSFFGRADLEYTWNLSSATSLTTRLGTSYEKADRDVFSRSLYSMTAVIFPLSATDRIDSSLDLEESLRTSEAYTRASFISAFTTASREIESYYLESKLSFSEKFEIIGGLRLERVSIGTVNEPFVFGTEDDLITFPDNWMRLPDGRVVEQIAWRPGVPKIVPSSLLMFERGGPAPQQDGFSSGATIQVDNPLLLGIPDAPDDITSVDQLFDALSGTIEKDLWLPSLGLIFRPREGLRVSLNYSQTTARPSFRELGYYLSAPEGTDDLVIGNPQLTTSDVESFDFRFEYLGQEAGDLAALSVFKKSVDRPIEKIRLTDPIGGSQYSTFFNNPNTADLKGLEFEFRKSLSFIPLGFLKHFSIGGNSTYIDAQIDRSEAFIGSYSQAFLDLPELVREGQDFEYTREPVLLALPSSRRLFNQPKWILNGDISFEHEEWGTQITLAAYAISDILESVGTVGIDRTGVARHVSVDRYIASFFKLDLVASQKIGDWTIKLSIKNFTDSPRRLIYDPYLVTDRTVQAERRFRVGVDYSFSASYTF